MGSRLQIPIRVVTLITEASVTAFYPSDSPGFGGPSFSQPIPVPKVAQVVQQQPAPQPVSFGQVDTGIRVSYAGLSQPIIVTVPAPVVAVPAQAPVALGYYGEFPKFPGLTQPTQLWGGVPPPPATVNSPSPVEFRPPVPIPSRTAFDAVRPVPKTPPPGMENVVKSISVTLGIVGSTIVVPHGLHSVPRLIFASISGRTELVDATGRLSNRRGYGVCSNAAGIGVVQFCAGSHSDNNVALTQADATLRNDAIIAVMAVGATSPGVTSGRLAVQSIDATNITFVINEQFDNNYTVHLEIIAGTDFTNISLASYNAPLAVGTQDLLLNFSPDFMWFLGGHLSQTPPDVENDSSTFIGACDKNLNQWTWSGGVNDDGGAGGSGRGRSYARAGDCMCILGSAVNPPNAIASVQQILSTGVRLNWTVLNLVSGQTKGRVFVMLAVQGGNWAVGNFLTQLDTNEHQVVSGLGFVPDGEMFVSACKPASTFNVLDANDQWSMGLAQDYSVNAAQGSFGKDVTSPTVQGASIAFASDYVETDMTGAIVSKFQVTSRQPDGFSIKHSVVGAQQNFVGYVTFAHIIPPPFSVVVKTVKPLGGGDYLSLNAALQSELANHKNLISQNIVLQFDCYRGFDTTPVTVPGQNNSGGAGYIADADHFVLVNVVEGHVGLPVVDGSAYLLDVTSTTVDALLIRCEYVRFKQMQVRFNVDSINTSLSTYHVGSTGMIAPTEWRFINCIAIANFTNGGAANGFFPPSSTFDVPGIVAIFVNCVAYNYLSQDHTITGFNTANTVNQKIVHLNCTAINCNQGFQDHSDVIEINCAAIGCDNGWNTSTGPNAASDYNFSTCGPPGINGAYYPGTLQTAVLDAKGTHSSNGLPVLMVNPLNGDYRPQYGETSLTGQGKNLTFNDYFPFNFDVANNPRPAVGPWTIGAFENIQAAQQVVRWVWSGGVSSSVATVKVALLQAEALVYLAVSQNADMSGAAVYGPIATGNNNIATFQLPCAASTKYYYQARIAGLPIGPVGAFTSFPVEAKPASFVLACGGCADTGSNSNIFTAVKAYNPLMFIWYGDMHYMNINTNNIALYRIGYEGVALAPKQASMIQSMACDMVWDDHDWGYDNSDGTNPGGPAAYAAYAENFPGYALPGTPNLIYHSYVIGRVRVILTDSRAARDPNANPDGPTHTMLGAEQLAWLKNELLLAKQQSQLTFLFLPDPWIAPVGDNSGDDWGGFANERRIIADYMESLGIRNLIRFCGDMHAAAIDDGSFDKYASDGIGNSLPTFLPYPLNQSTQIYGGMYSDGVVTHAATRLMGFAGIVQVTDDSQTITVKLSVVNELGIVLTRTLSYAIPYSPFTPEFPTPEAYTAETPVAESYTPEGPRQVTFTQEQPGGAGFTQETPVPINYTKQDGT